MLMVDGVEDGAVCNLRQIATVVLGVVGAEGGTAVKCKIMKGNGG